MEDSTTGTADAGVNGLHPGGVGEFFRCAVVLGCAGWQLFLEGVGRQGVYRVSSRDALRPPDCRQPAVDFADGRHAAGGRPTQSVFQNISLQRPNPRFRPSVPEECLLSFRHRKSQNESAVPD